MPFFGGTKDISPQAPDWQVELHGPPALVVTPRYGVILTSGSDLDQAAVPSGDRGLPWPRTFSAAVRRMVANWKPDRLREIYNVNIAGNYGSKGSEAQYGWRGSEFGSVGLHSSPIPNPLRPMYNNLVPIVYHLYDVDLTAQAQPSDLVQIQVLPVGPVDFTPGGSASLQETLQ